MGSLKVFKVIPPIVKFFSIVSPHHIYRWLSNNVAYKLLGPRPKFLPIRNFGYTLSTRQKIRSKALWSMFLSNFWLAISFTKFWADAWREKNWRRRELEEKFWSVRFILTQFVTWHFVGLNICRTKFIRNSVESSDSRYFWNCRTPSESTN